MQGNFTAPAATAKVFFPIVCNAPKKYHGCNIFFRFGVHMNISNRKILPPNPAKEQAARLQNYVAEKTIHIHPATFGRKN